MSESPRPADSSVTTTSAHLVADLAVAGKRVDAAVAAQLPDLSRSLVRSLIDEGRVRVNGQSVRPAYRLKAGDEISIEPIISPSLRMHPEEIPLQVLYEDHDLAVIDKPARLVVHPAAGHEGGTLANAVLARFPNAPVAGQETRPGIVHRLDKDTSGLIVIALNPRAQISLQRQIGEREAERRYLALATGKVEPAEGTIEAPIGRDPGNRKRMSVHGIAARPARTSYRVIEYLGGFTLLDVRLHTGRTHQIRVHLAALGHPVAGDRTYHGASLSGLDRQFLHAYRLSLRSPSSGETLDFRSPLPADLQAVLETLGAGAVPSNEPMLSPSEDNA